MTATEIKRLGLKSPKGSGKTFVLDTNVLLHDPGCLNRFADNHVCLPVDILVELDRFKNEHTERGANARRAHRTLAAMFVDGTQVSQGVPTDGGGTVRLVLFDPQRSEETSAAVRQFFELFADRTKVDNRILACAKLLEEHNSEQVILVTKDLNMQLKARAVGLICQDYLNDKVDPQEVSSHELVVVPVNQAELQRFASSGHLDLEETRIAALNVNQYVMLEAGERQSMVARLDVGNVFVRLMVPDQLQVPGGQVLKPLNVGQRCLIDALVNPEISLVTCYGQAGTGKTLVAVAAGLSEIFNRRYIGLTVSRPVVAMGEQLGFLPGTLEEKMRPWLQPIYDSLDWLFQTPLKQGAKRKMTKKAPLREPTASTGRVEPQRAYDYLLETGVIEIEALAYIRGRSIPNRFFILDEAQQLTPQEAKTVVTRMSRGSKLVLIGDPDQIDNPYVDSRSNGLVYTRNRLKSEAFTAHISLSKGERSELAEAGARLM